MWILYALGSSFFAGVTAVLAKCGIKRTDSTVATAIRTVVVFTVFMADGMFGYPPRAALTAKWEDVVFFDFIRPLYRVRPGCVIFGHCSWDASIRLWRLINQVPCSPCCFRFCFCRSLLHGGRGLELYCLPWVLF